MADRLDEPTTLRCAGPGCRRRVSQEDVDDDDSEAMTAMVDFVDGEGRDGFAAFCSDACAEAVLGFSPRSVWETEGP